MSCFLITNILLRSIRGFGPITELQRLTVSLRGGFERKKGCLVFYFTGQLDAYSEKQFTDFVNDVLSSNKLPIVLDLTKIDFIDSSGLGAMVHSAKKCKKDKRSFVVVGNPRVIQTIKLVRLEDFLHVAADLNAALTQLAA
ncbi:putative anti-sigma factor antagonist [Prochlorococcus marinus str. SS51]|uniref:Anti-sigma factor antagonist n=1 Tax=Prochlorococcus marinus (strain SARG / CCMP1375 / SS120) TaxID=167539 RepID=Q7VCJ4_PROMA|nr:Anti-anti-sigma regulatory factor [Prochlorococcus marinus subsp. marinus str. CCMP1375]KGG21828.1 putative anti-sigma factor antagonist [Prochlorococcus marinus str. SS2]KGG23741.1 putative anti-sigma factor antagonist [Prochlorococcus marinus str. SS35]KGG32023.1 putative anti-sigma factor antagonist [Prochlorococcus marinus str. SS51]